MYFQFTYWGIDTAIPLQGYLAHKKQPPPLGPPTALGAYAMLPKGSVSVSKGGLAFPKGPCVGMHRGTSLIRNTPALGPYSRLMPTRALWWS